MNTTPAASAAVCADAWLAIRRVCQTFAAHRPSAGSPEWKQLLRDWARLAAVPPAVVESTFYGGAISCEEDARRIVASALEMERRIAAVSAELATNAETVEAELPGFALQ